MKRLPLLDAVLSKYPDLAGTVKISQEEAGQTADFPFQNPKYSFWFSEQDDGGFIVGIDFYHHHFTTVDFEINFEEALFFIDEVIENKIVAIGITEKESDFLLTIMPTKEGIEKYSSEKPEIEIVSFSREF